MSDKPLDCAGTTGPVGKHDFRAAPRPDIVRPGADSCAPVAPVVDGMPGWLPIESAPYGESGKPETYILISKQEQGTTLVATGYRNAHGAYEWFGGGMGGITHWMPLPPPPADLVKESVE